MAFAAHFDQIRPQPARTPIIWASNYACALGGDSAVRRM